MLKLLNIKAAKENDLDVGCFDAYWLSTQDAKNKYGLDINIKAEYQSVNYIKESVLNMLFEENKFNQVFAFDVIEHIPKDTETQFLSELIKVTKRGGEIIFTVPSKNIKIFPPFLTNWVSRKWGHFKYNGLSKKELKQYLKKFDSVRHEIIEKNAYYYLRSYLFIKLLWELCWGFAKRIVERIANRDSRNLRGDNGYYIVRLTKREL